MISNQILQNTIDGLKAITRTDLCVIDVEGKILVATFPDAEQFVAPAQLARPSWNRRRTVRW